MEHRRRTKCRAGRVDSDFREIWVWTVKPVGLSIDFAGLSNPVLLLTVLTSADILKMNSFTSVGLMVWVKCRTMDFAGLVQVDFTVP